jgi:hypothetical protein
MIVQLIIQGKYHNSGTKTIKTPCGGKLECSQKPYCNYFNFIISGKCIKMRKELIFDNYGISVE